MTTITTPEELDALPTRTTVLNSRGDAWQRRGNRWYVVGSAGGQRTVPYLPARVLDRPDQPTTSAAPTVKQIADAIYSVLNSQYGDFNWPDDAAEAVAALYPTCQPSREQLMNRIAWARVQTGTGKTLPELVADAALALLPGRSEAEVKAEALGEAADEIDTLYFGPAPMFSQAAGHRWGSRKAAERIRRQAAALRSER